MNADRTDELGIQWAAAGQVGSRVVGAAANFPAANPSLAAAVASPATAGASAAGLTVAVLGSKITLRDGTTVTSLGALARALQANNLGNILSTPNLLTLDNYQAKIVIGQNVPFVTGSFAAATTAAAAGVAAVNPFQTIERKDVGLTLRIKPQISEGSTIRLEIYQEVSSVNTTARAGPFLGALFRFKSEERKRTNLMIFLRPVIIRSVEDGYRVTQDRYEYLRGYTRGEGPERENIYDRMEPVPPAPPREPPARTPGRDSPAAPAREPEAGATPAPARP